MKILELIPSLIKKFVGYSCFMFMAGWGLYDRFENRLNANNELVMKEARSEIREAIYPIEKDVAVIKNDTAWIKAYLQKNNP